MNIHKLYLDFTEKATVLDKIICLLISPGTKSTYLPSFRGTDGNPGPDVKGTGIKTHRKGIGRFKFGHTGIICFFLVVLSCKKQNSWNIYTAANTALTSNRIRQIVLENNEISWVGTYGGGLFRMRNNTLSKVTAPFKGNYILSLKKDRRGGIWIGTAQNGAFYCFNDSWKQYTGDHGLAGNNVWDIFIENEETVWFCSRYKGVCRKQNDSLFCFNSQNGLPDRQVTVAVKDTKGTMWFGTVRGGLAGYRDGQFEYINTSNGLSGNYIRAILCDSVPRWVGSWDGGLDYCNGEQWEHIPAVQKPVVFLGYSKNGILWVGTWGYGVFYRHGQTWESLNTGNSLLPDNYVIDIDFSEKNTVYFATSKGIAVYTP